MPAEEADWQEAPTEWQLSTYDTFKIEYRQAVERMIAAVPKKNLKKKSFVTICTNVLCAEKDTSRVKAKDNLVAKADIDIYLPLEISLNKWNVSDSNKPIEERTITAKFWMINPGSIPAACRNYALDHKKKHLIEYQKLKDTDNFVEGDIHKIVKEINSTLLPDRTVFSLQLRHCRQDLGCLKWLNRAIDYKMAPIIVYSLEDLYVVLLRGLSDDEDTKLAICLGLANHRLDNSRGELDVPNQCDYHQAMLRHDTDAACTCCAKALSLCRTNILLDDIALFTKISNVDPKVGH